MKNYKIRSLRETLQFLEPIGLFSSKLEDFRTGFRIVIKFQALIVSTVLDITRQKGGKLERGWEAKSIMD